MTIHTSICLLVGGLFDRVRLRNLLSEEMLTKMYAHLYSSVAKQYIEEELDERAD
jgi:hypothetical protein